MTANSRREALLLPVLAATGAAALLHETAWMRCLVPALGAGALPAAAVSGGVLLGLGLGAAVGGRLADRSARPARVFAGAELVAAALAFAVPPTSRALAGSLADPWPLLLGVLLLAAVSTPLGASLPAALAALAPSRARAGSVFRRLYGVNTLGAVAGVLLAAGWVLETLGNRGTIVVAAVLQVAAAGAVLAVAGRWTASPSAPAETTGPRHVVPARLLGAAALAGGAGLAVQVAWVRRLLPVVGYSTQSFAVVLATSLLGIALGSLLLGPRGGRGTGRRGALLVLVLAAVPVAFLPEAVSGLDAWAAARLLEASSPGPGLRLLVGAAAAAFVLVPSTAVGAAALPWLVRVASTTTGEGAASHVAGRVAGRLLAANAVASAAVALLTATLWLPAVGSAAVLRGAAGLYVGAAALLAPRPRGAVLAALAALLFLLQPWLRPRADDAYFDGVGATWQPAAFAPRDAPRLFAREGPVATVVVRDREGERELWVDAKIVASTFPADRLHLALLGHLPMALSPSPRRVAILGLGTGLTAQAVAAYAPEQLDIYELEPAVARAARQFEDLGGGVPEGARVIPGDGRRALRRTHEVYDVITSDPIHPGVGGSAWLYSLEHWKTLAARAPVVAQWVPLYQMTVEDVRLVFRTFAAAFPYAYAFLAAQDVILVGTREPLALDETMLRARLDGPAGAGLAAFGLRAPGRLLGLLAQGPDGVRLFGGEGPLNHDDRLLLEFRAGRSADVDESAHLVDLLVVGRPAPQTLLAAPPSPAFRREVLAAKALSRATRCWLDDDAEGATRRFGRIAAADPADAYARTQWIDASFEVAWEAVLTGRFDTATEIVEEVLAEGPRLPRQTLDAVEILVAAGQRDRAREVLETAGFRDVWPRGRRLARELGRS